MSSVHKECGAGTVMKATATYLGHSVKKVVVTDVTTETEREVLDLALVTAGETKVSAFGWEIWQRGTTVHVMIYTD